MQAIILAAGMGKRLKELTHDNTKCMVQVCGETLIERMLRQQDRLNLERIVIVVGYQGRRLIDFVSSLDIKTPIEFIENPIYDKTNNIYSLSLAKERLLEDDTLLFESDIIFEDSVLDALVQDPRPTLALVDKYEPWMDGTCVRLSGDDEIIEFIPGKKFNHLDSEDCYKTVNIYKFSREFSRNAYVPFLEAYQKALGENEYYEQVLMVIAMLNNSELRAKRLEGEKWYEIDDIQDLDIATSIFASDDEKLPLMMKRYGGYWRYPKLLDFCYLVNPYFPPQKLKNEMIASFDVLLTQYPSGMHINSLLAAKDFSVHEENIVVGNGAAELIKALMERIEGKIGFVRPTFEEYPNRADKDREVVYTPSNENFSYSVDDLISFFSDKDISALVVVNPDNPTGSYIKKKDLLRLVSWSKEKGITLVIDESFVDFAEDEDSSLIEQSILSSNRHLFVMKSISKSYGVPGLRLGVLASGDVEAIKAIKKSVSIWNINSFAEFYLQIEEKYHKDYLASLTRIKEERERFFSKLSSIEGLRAIPSEANYIMVEITNGKKATEVTKRLLSDYGILIKDLSAKIKGGEYLRLAVRDTKDNDKLIDALSNVL